ncbi:amino acid ABC transporter permease [Candidatus Geothermarchaeota archaeon]|nr:MAG: amino acid ABC transporter permease [Candidatus Geothermarchaeota archaeon]HEW93172.1 amino acid ABC transporter permease [Thermoprotei archaeon]
MDFWSNFLINLVQGLTTTLQILVISIPLSIITGFILGFARVYGNKIIFYISTGISTTFRGLPLIVTLLILFFGLADLKIYLSPFWASILGFTLCGGSYISEYVKGAIQSIEQGQAEAARALGMNKLQEIIYIILPQTLIRALPGVSNEIIYMIQYSSLSFVIGVKEIFSVAKTFNSLYFRSIEIFTTVAFVYLLLIAIATLVFKIIENKLKIT